MEPFLQPSKVWEHECYTFRRKNRQTLHKHSTSFSNASFEDPAHDHIVHCGVRPCQSLRMMKGEKYALKIRQRSSATNNKQRMQAHTIRIPKERMPGPNGKVELLLAKSKISNMSIQNQTGNRTRRLGSYKNYQRRDGNYPISSDRWYRPWSKCPTKRFTCPEKRDGVDARWICTDALIYHGKIARLAQQRSEIISII